MDNHNKDYDIIDQFVKESYNKYKSYSYAAGYLQSKLFYTLLLLPKEEREWVLKTLQKSTEDFMKKPMETVDTSNTR